MIFGISEPFRDTAQGNILVAAAFNTLIDFFDDSLNVSVPPVHSFITLPFHANSFRLLHRNYRKKPLDRLDFSCGTFILSNLHLFINTDQNQESAYGLPRKKAAPYGAAPFHTSLHPLDY